MDPAIADPDDCEIEMVEVQDGLVSGDTDVNTAVRGRAKVLAGLGYDCVATLDEYF